ncbi:MAG TPA: WYL domain-containing protein, partial [Blastocatellia bacterium]|nr:WYL domain-containing protein [Blastocatellia bacterium]
TIARHFEISTRTAQRTLDFMRDRLRLPLGYSSERHGWYFTEPTYGLRAIELTEGDLVAILLTERLAREYRGLAIGKQVEEAFAKVLDAMTNIVSIDFESLSEAYSFEANATVEIAPEVFQQLGRAAKERLRVEMTYYTAMRGEVTRRRADPLHLRSYLGEWYLIAFDHYRGEVRDFNIGRIRELVVLDERFEWPEGFDLAEYLDSGFAMVRGREPFDVEIAFDEYQARWIRERGPVHPTERREELPDGGLLIRMRVTALDSVKRFVMQYGSHARVIAPERLREMVREDIEAMRALYEDSER